MQIHQKKDVWPWAGLALLVGLILFPYGWLANNWDYFDQLMNFLFASEGMHIVGHMGLYLGLGTAVLIIFPSLIHRSSGYFGLMLGIGFIQEALPLLTFKHHFFSANEVFDLSINLLAAGLVFAAWKMITQKYQR